MEAHRRARPYRDRTHLPQLRRAQPRRGAELRALRRAAGPLGARRGDPIYARDPQRAQSTQAAQAPRIEAYAPGRDGGIYRREIGPDDPIDGIKARDWASYVGKSSPYYLMQFFRMSETRRRVGVCFSAFFLGPIYFFYRKMWREGALFAALTLLVQVPDVVALLAQAGVPFFAGLNLGWLPAAANICYIGGWLLNVVMGLYAVYWYKQEAGRRIRDIYARIPDGPDRADALALTGGTSLPAALLYLMLYFMLCTAVAIMAGPYLQAYLFNMAL